MAVWTQINNAQLDEFLINYNLGQVLAFKGIAEGVENSNYFLQAERGNYILTLYEKRVNEKDLPFFLGLMNHLSNKGLNVAAPIKRDDGKFYGHIAQRAAAVISFLKGLWQKNPSEHHCMLLGGSLAQIHLAGKDFELSRPNNMGISHWDKLLENCAGINEGFLEKLQTEISHLKKIWEQLNKDLPRGIIHGDCFPDNVLFDGNKASIIDFYFACEDLLAYDIAICLNSWCWQDGWNKANALALIRGYEKQRKLTSLEKAALPLLCRGAATRFLLTRTADKLQFDKNMSSSGAVFPKNPGEYEEILRFHQSNGEIL